MTPKKKVLKEWSKAFCYRSFRGGYGVTFRGDYYRDGYGKTPYAAWADAASRLKKGRGK